MKKITAAFLTMLMIASLLVVPASAAGEEKHEKNPIIYISGSSIDICNADGKVISTGFDVLTDDDEGDMTTEDIIESAVNIILPFVIEGLPEDKWDDYGKALYEELAPIWDETQLDGDGNAKYGTGVSQAEIDKWNKKAASVNTGADGKFNLRDYDFRYDWRLSPYDHVDRLHEYIKTILKTTGCDQVSLVGRCIGGNIITAYLDVYGSEGLVKKVFYDEVMSNGSAVFNDCFSGRIKFSDKHAQAYLVQAEYFGQEDTGVDLSTVNSVLLEVVDKTLDLITQIGVTDSILDGVEDLYDRLYTAFMPSMLLATGIGTWANYWVSVYDEDYDRALDLIFGEEGSETRASYAGLIEKLEQIRGSIISARPELYDRFVNEYGVEIGILASYGLANAPIIEHYDETGDTLVGVTDASFGATAGGLFTNLSKDYIDKKTAEGLGDYISPDGKIDASTCKYPETTWFIKNKHHDYWSAVVYLAEYFTQYTNVTASDNNRNISRFLVHDKSAKGEIANMTADNMADGPWLGAVEQEPTKESKLASLMRFFTALLNFFTKLFKGEITFDGLFD